MKFEFLEILSIHLCPSLNMTPNTDLFLLIFLYAGLVTSGCGYILFSGMYLLALKLSFSSETIDAEVFIVFRVLDIISLIW